MIVKIELPPLPYKYNALEPVISQKIMELHHDKHHKSYVDGANAALEKLEKYRKGEIEIDVRATLRDLSFHMNGHVLHSIFWPNMKPPEENNKPGGKIADLINKVFGSFESFKKEFSNAAKSVEGSGWAVLAKDEKDNLYVFQIEKHNLMHVAGFKPLLVLDVWEHAYYLDYLNDRGKYVDNWWKVVNWDDVEKRLSGD
ncbi:MAG: superoxide dismutase [Candidatus Aenigmarchaeota archaeon]|jgi:Fe-Mn family superoxide dismutase|nr:superoxide dismutase [Candidatus Aenigmarchaeota archaeon]